MAQDSTAKYSPRWLADKLIDAEDKVFASVVPLLEKPRNAHIFNIVIFFVLILFALFFRSLAAKLEVDMNISQLFLTGRYTSLTSLIFLLAAIGTFAYYLKKESLASLDVLAFIIGFSSLYFYRNIFFRSGPLPPTLNLALEFFFFLLFYTLRRRFNGGFLKWDFIFAAYLVLFFSNSIESFFQWDVPPLFDTPRMFFIFSFLAAEYQVKKRATPREDFGYIFSAMNLITPVPVELKHRERTEDWNIRLRGLRDIFVGMACLILARQTKLWWVEFPLDLNPSRILAYGFSNYIYYFLGSYAWISIPVGLGRWFGMKLPDGFDLPLLSCSPSDRWRRWNTYYYNWFYKILFFPIFKRTRSLALAIFAVFLGTLIIHAGRFNYGLFLGQVSSLYQRTFILVVLFFAAHCALIYLGVRFPRMWPSEKKLWGWMGVIWMTFLMALIHIIGPR